MEPRGRNAEAELDDILEYCNTLRQSPPPADDALPAGFTGTLGHFPVYFPEEIAHAAGLLPVNVLGGGNKLELKHADAHMGSFICSICRSTTEMGLNGGLKGLKGFITHPICDAAKHLAGIWSRNIPEQLAQIRASLAARASQRNIHLLAGRHEARPPQHMAGDDGQRGDAG